MHRGDVKLHRGLQRRWAGTHQTNDVGDGAASLSNFTRTYLLQADVRGLQIAAELDTLLKRDQIDIGLPLIIDALAVRLTQGKK